MNERRTEGLASGCISLVGRGRRCPVTGARKRNLGNARNDTSGPCDARLYANPLAAGVLRAGTRHTDPIGPVIRRWVCGWKHPALLRPRRRGPNVLAAPVNRETSARRLHALGQARVPRQPGKTAHEKCAQKNAHLEKSVRCKVRSP